MALGGPLVFLFSKHALEIWPSGLEFPHANAACPVSRTGLVKAS